MCDESVDMGWFTSPIVDELTFFYSMAKSDSPLSANPDQTQIHRAYLAGSVRFAVDVSPRLGAAPFLLRVTVVAPSELGFSPSGHLIPFEESNRCMYDICHSLVAKHESLSFTCIERRGWYECCVTSFNDDDNSCEAPKPPNTFSKVPIHASYLIVFKLNLKYDAQHCKHVLVVVVAACCSSEAEGHGMDTKKEPPKFNPSNRITDDFESSSCWRRFYAQKTESPRFTLAVGFTGRTSVNFRAQSL
ncbi:hypothetical protein EI94DRAFT_1791923 [Lactarius quietus]|nr:hypothetical protein EI94DRAFT_1791923 [Lactarius quietus]